ncbi:MAG: amidohydrolase [Phycisphaeraceae bacterium]|nr:amidohydrolase [Phycisphaeraceae bacterium]
MPQAGTELRTLIERELPELVEIRHDLHRHPELGYQEARTSGVVRRELERLGIEFRAGIARTGVLAHLPATGGRTDGAAIALRADMDALPIEETTGCTYASVTPGVMHACGHDGHTTILLGAARVLSKVDRPRPVTLVFQPAEEGGAGGEAMCEQGALRGERGGGLGPPVGAIYGLHGWPQMRLGHIGTRAGPLLAATDDFIVAIEGTQCHAAFPHLGTDAVLASAHVVTALQSIASRSVSPLDSVVVTVGRIAGGTANNVIPRRVELVGTVRTLRDSTRRLARERFFEVVGATASAFRCRASIDWQEGYPVTHNDPGATAQVLEVARGTVGPGRAVELAEGFMGGEDFSYYGQHVPACFFLLGLTPEHADPASAPQLHQPTFDFNDEAIATGVEMMCRLAGA